MSSVIPSTEISSPATPVNPVASAIPATPVTAQPPQDSTTQREVVFSPFLNQMVSLSEKPSHKK